MAYTIAIANHAGGVGKTTTAFNLGYSLAARGRRVLLVDLDPQADLTDRLGVSEAGGLARALQTGTTHVQVMRCAWDTGFGIDLIPSNLEEMAGVELALAGVVAGRELRLARALAPFQNQYDYIVIDCP